MTTLAKKGATRRHLNAMRSALEKGDFDQFDRHRMAIQSIFGAARPCPITIITILSKKMPKEDVDKYSELCKEATIKELGMKSDFKAV